MYGQGPLPLGADPSGKAAGAGASEGPVVPVSVAGGSMGSAGDSARGEDRVPRLAPGCAPTNLDIGPTEAFLLSRIDGATSWATLRKVCGLPPQQVDQALARLLKAGAIVLDGDDGPGADGPSAAATPQAPAPNASARGQEAIVVEVDESLDLSVEVQRQVLDFESRLQAPYHELLGVAVDADVRVIKKAYFKLSKSFHPDRYFRRNLGPFQEKIEAIFKKILEAYELLSDPATREELQKSLQAARAAPPPAAPAAEGAAPKRPRPFAGRGTLLAGHRRFIDDRKRKAKTLFESGMGAFHAERWIEAAASVRLAIAFDPLNEAYKESFAPVQRKAHDERSKQLMGDAEKLMDVGDYKPALKCLEDALPLRPYDAALHHKAAMLAWKAEQDLRRAKEYSATACELEPDNSAYRRQLGQIYKDAGLKANARRELEAALRLDDADVEARAALKGL